MKKNLLKVFLLSVATAGMVFSSCTNYDDDINDLNQKIEDLSGKVTLKADMSAVEALESKLQGVDFSKYVTAEGLDAAIKAVEDQTKADIDAAIKGIKSLSEDDVKGIFTEQMKAYDIWGSVQTKVAEAIKSALAENQGEIIAAAVAEIQKDGSDIQKAILSIVGKDMEAALANYVTKDALGVYATDASVDEKLAAANKALVDEITKQIDANNTIQKTDLDKAFAEYDKQIAELWSAVGNLAGRIQSLVYVPVHVDGTAVFGSYKVGTASLTKGDGVKATMTFRVSPASLTDALVKGYADGTVKMNILPEKVTRADAIEYKVEGVTGKDGKIDLLVRTNYDYATATETYAVALQVIDSKKVGDGDDAIETGTEFTSAYVPTEGSAAEDVYDNIVLVKDLKEVDPMAISDDIEYNDVATKHTFLSGYKYAYKDGANVITLADAAKKYNWDVTPDETPVLARTAFTATGVADLAVNPENPMANATAKAKVVTVNLKQATAANIGKSVTDEGNLIVKVGTASVSGSKAYKAKLNITKEQLEAIDLGTVNFVWNYTNYSTAAAYVDSLTLASGKLTSAQFNDLDIANADYDIPTTSNFVSANAIAVAVEKASTPSVNSDAQILKLSVSGYNRNSGDITFEVKVPVSTVAEVKFSGKIVFEGLPEVSFPVSVPAGQYTVQSGKLIVPVAENFNDSLYTDNEAQLKKYFGTKENFLNFMHSGAVESFPVEKRKLNSASTASDYAGLQFDASALGYNDVLNAYFVANHIDFNAHTEYTYSIQAGTKVEVAAAGFKVNIPVKKDAVKISKDNNFYLLRGVDLFTNADPYYLVAPGVRDSDTYTISNINLANAYTGTGTGTVVSYSIGTAPEGYDTSVYSYPEVDDDRHLLDWKGCSLDEVTVTAKMTVNGLLADVKTFSVKRKDILAGNKPVQDKTVNVLKVGTDGNDDTISLLTGVTLKDFADSLVIDPVLGALDAKSQAAYGTEVTYGAPSYRVKAAGASSFVAPEAGFTFDRLSISTTGVLTVAGSNAELANEIEVTVPVKLTHKYSVYEADKTAHTWKPKAIEFNVVFVIKAE